MNLGQQIKARRSALGLSQDVLAERIYVSRQTISNWENDKSYPDLNSLLRLSEVFQVSLDTLVKGDREAMKETIGQEDRQQFQKMGAVLTLLFLAMLLTPVPLMYVLDWAGFALWALLAVVSLYTAHRVKKLKQAFDVQTYREISAFLEGKGLDEIAKAQEAGKRPYQKAFLALGAGLLALAISSLMAWCLPL